MKINPKAPWYNSSAEPNEPQRKSPVRCATCQYVLEAVKDSGQRLCHHPVKANHTDSCVNKYINRPFMQPAPWWCPKLMSDEILSIEVSKKRVPDTCSGCKHLRFNTVSHPYPQASTYKPYCGVGQEYDNSGCQHFQTIAWIPK